MINKAAYDTVKSMQSANWQQQLRLSIKDPETLLKELNLSHELISMSENSCHDMPLRVPRGFVSRMEKNNPHDPLLRQVLPLVEEERQHPDFSHDPVGELGKSNQSGVLHKYHGRALLITTGACAIHCRYCFRRHFPYEDENAANQNWNTAINYLEKDSSIKEVILSGGDPLALADDKLSQLIQRLEGVTHLKRLRIHTRMPVVLPDRVTGVFMDTLSNSRLTPLTVIHTNHPNELNNDVQLALAELKQAGLVVMNQSVLLNGINDDWETLAELSEALFESGVLPYYLHLLDPVSGATHFDVDEDRARVIMQGLRKHLSGYLIPRLVRERAGADYKLPVL